MLERFLWLRSKLEGLSGTRVWSVGEEVRAGQELGRITDYEGCVLQQAISPAEGRVLFIVSSLAINDTDPFLALGA